MGKRHGDRKRKVLNITHSVCRESYCKLLLVRGVEHSRPGAFVGKRFDRRSIWSWSNA